ncbi:DUF3017 domain-containing protein [Streptomyces sp. NPDC051561]|uniref:DUF3017 domain-containing protein n=1 Tax=Streptomyces sp. NPDC051561 TaxID=3365658 RepID=UPI00379B6948
MAGKAANEGGSVGAEDRATAAPGQVTGGEPASTPGNGSGPGVESARAAGAVTEPKSVAEAAGPGAAEVAPSSDGEPSSHSEPEADPEPAPKADPEPAAPEADPEPAAKGAVSAPGPDGPVKSSRRFPMLTRDTARPEGGGRAAGGDAPAPARQWPLITVLGMAGVGLLLVAVDAFDMGFRLGTVLIGVAMLTGGAMRWVLPSVGMLAVRSRFTDIVTYGVLGLAITMLAMMTQPDPWLTIPVLETAVRFTVR